MKATFIKDLEGFNGEAALYELDPPAEYDKPWDENDEPAKQTSFVVVSAANVMFSGPETYIFAANKDGEIIDWSEMEGSFRGGLNHAAALAGAGYVIARKESA